MNFVIFRHSENPDRIVVTDEEHRDKLPPEAYPVYKELEEIGVFPELGEKRVAFNEALAKEAIKKQGYYAFQAKSFDPVAQAPGSMPV